MIRFWLSVASLVLFLSTANAQFISQVFEYNPAPGQYINTSPWGNPAAAQSIVGTVDGTMNLGAFGGYVIFRFENPVENNPNNPFGMDFSIFGNSLGDFSEAAIVYVMKDENNNNLPDDTWYELAGSEYFFSSSRRNHEVTFTNPGTHANVPWEDNAGNSGEIAVTSFHPQNYYPLNDSFPSIGSANHTYSGGFIEAIIDDSNPANVKSIEQAFGYADNKTRGNAPFTVPDNPYTQEKENAGGDAFDISWAVDENGNYIDLDEIHFIKVQNALNANAGWLGEISTEITGASIVEPNSSISGETQMLIMKDIPTVINENDFQLEIFAYEMGRKTDATINFTLSKSDVTVDDNYVIHATTSGEIILTASLESNPQIKVEKTFTMNVTSNVNEELQNISIYPTIASKFININGYHSESISIFNANGQLIKHITSLENNQLSIEDLPNGLLIFKISDNKGFITRKVIKQ